MMEIVREVGGTAVQEVSFNSEPDIVFDLAGRRWLLGVKIGDDAAILRQGFLQYLRHKRESRLDHGLLLFLPLEARHVPARHEALWEFLCTTRAYCLLDTPTFQEEVGTLTFPDYLRRVATEILPRVNRGERSAFSLVFAIRVLKQHIQALMQEVHLTEDQLLDLVTNPALFAGLANIEGERREQVGKFLAAYIVLSQILFLRLLGTANPDVLPPQPVTSSSLRRAFRRVLDINYRPIYSLDVLGSLEEEYIRDTFDIIWGLRVEEVQHELPGRIYHELMPPRIRKMLAAFYTRPVAAELMAKLCIERFDALVFDPACGSGTILTSAYRRKKECYYNEGKVGNPHRRFCEDEIFGIDIMPFSVHLTAANLAALDPRTTISHTQIGLADSLALQPENDIITTGLRQLAWLFPEGEARGFTSIGEVFDMTLPQVDVVLMNPPFTKLERGIGDYVNLERYEPLCGSEVGLWGHFMALAYEFLKPGGVLGAVLPVNVLRGNESRRVRELLFSHMTPLFILKPVVNYGFSEWAEYRDIIVVCRKERVPRSHRVKFVLVRKDLNALTPEDVDHVVRLVKTQTDLRREEEPVEIASFPWEEVRGRFDNLMWFCGATSFAHRDFLIGFVERARNILSSFPFGYFREGYRPVPQGVSKFLFLTRHSDPSRVEQAYLTFAEEDERTVRACSRAGISYTLEKNAFAPALRTATGLRTLNLKGKWDYVATRPYAQIGRIARASGFSRGDLLEDARFWQRLTAELTATQSYLLVNHRINPFSPGNYLVAFVSPEPLSPANTLHATAERDLERAKAVAVLLNSAFFWAWFFLLKEESTGRWINLRHHDLYEMTLYPREEQIPALSAVFDEFAEVSFLAFIYQVDQDFDRKYQSYRDSVPRRAEPDFTVAEFIPAEVRLAFDKAVVASLNLPVTEDELLEIYRILAKEMIVTKALARD
ncbi:MAG: N-6 DNA methylase [Firmicutes bacterium]|nr:N-6 DNA methylase [Bacillota bacterium]